MPCAVLAVRRDCPLCDDARSLLRDLGHDFTEVTAADDELVPVLTVDGEVIARGRVHPWRLRWALRRARRSASRRR